MVLFYSNICTMEGMRDEREQRLAGLESEVADACGALNVAHARLVSCTAQLLESGLWKGYGIRSIEHWLTLRAGLSPERARHIADVAKRAGELPVTLQTLADGELSFEQAHAVARHARAHNDAEAASLAKVTTVTQIRSTLSRYTFVVDDTAEGGGSVDADGSGDHQDGSDAIESTSSAAAVDPAAEAAKPGWVQMGHAGSRFSLRLDAPALEGALLQAAISEAKDALIQQGQPAVTLLDALVEVCNRSLDKATPARRVDKYRIYAHLDTTGHWLNAGPALPPSVMNRLLCDRAITALWETDGKPVNVGRAMRIVPDRTRRLCQDRDRHCTFPGCTARGWLEVHHIVHWADGGATDSDNLTSLCPHHHDAHHRGEYAIAGNADHPPGTSASLTFTDTTGHRIGIRPPRPPDGPPPTPPDGHRYKPPTGERLQTRWIHLTPPPDSIDTIAS